MDTETLELLCQKLGTTLDNLIPAAIEFGKHDAVYTIKAGFCCIVACAIFAFIAYRLFLIPESTKFDSEFVGMWVVLISILIGIFGVFFIIYGITEHHYWRIFPKMKAYKMLLGWVK